MTLIEIANIISDHYKELDKTIEPLSHLKEDKIAELPDYVFSKKQLIVLKLNDTNNYFVKGYLNSQINKNQAFVKQVDSAELAKYTAPYEFDISRPEQLPFGNMQAQIIIKQGEQTNEVPVETIFILGFFKGQDIPIVFSKEQAKLNAIDIWNNTCNNLTTEHSFVYNLKKIFDKLSGILHIDAFTERKIHRYINSNKVFLLPSFQNCYFEHPLYLDDNKKVADFILERELGLAPILIELESPIHDAFKQNSEPRAVTHHAGEQIKDWVMYIARNSKNCEGAMNFLAGQQERLVIIGKGLEYLEEMKKSKYGENKIWTYDLLILEAKKRWNQVIIEQCNKIGISNPNLLELPS